MKDTLIASPPRDNLARALFDERPVMFRRSEDPEAASRYLGVLDGTMCVIGQWTEINSYIEGHFMEQFAPGAFDKTFAEHRDKMRCIFHHGRDASTGIKVLGPIEELFADERTATYAVPLLKTDYNAELIPGLEEGLYGSSFLFSIIKENYVRRPRASDHNPNGIPERTVKECRVYEMGPTPFSQYDGTTTGMRSRTDEMVVQRDPERLAELLQRSGISLAGVEVPHATAGTGAGGTTLQIVRDFPTPAAPDALALAEIEEQHARSADPSHRYARSIEFIKTTPWLIWKPALETIKSVVARRAEGITMSDEEIRDRIGARAATPQPDGKVAVIGLYGPLLPRATLFSQLSGATSVDMFIAKFRAAMDDDNVRAVVLDVDSPGGSSALVKEAYDEVFAARGTKPIYAVCNTLMASAAYYIACAADKIFVTTSGMIGSVGVYWAHEDTSQAEEMAGIKTTYVSAGEYKTELFDGPLDPDAAGHMQSIVDSLYGEFVSSVAAARGIKESVIRDKWYARVYRPEDAVKLGMADEVATFDSVLAQLNEQAPEPDETDPPLPVEPDDIEPEQAAGGLVDFSAVSARGAYQDAVTASPASALSVLVGAGYAARSVIAALKADDWKLLVRSDAATNELSDATTGTSDAEPPDALAEGAGAEPHSEPVSRAAEPKDATSRATPDAPAGAEAPPHSEPTTDPASGGTTQPERSNVNTIEEMRARQRELEQLIREIDTENQGAVLDPETQALWDSHNAEYDDLEERCQAQLQRTAQLERRAGIEGARVPVTDGPVLTTPGSRGGVGGPRVAGDDLFDLSTIRTSATNPEAMGIELRSRALKVLEAASFGHPQAKKEQVQDRINFLLENEDTKDGALARHMLVTGSPLYRRSFGKIIASGGQATSLTSTEQAALAQARALSLSDPAGGFAVPFQLDPTVILTSNGVINPLRQISRVEQIVTDKWKGVRSDGITVSRSAEAEEADDNSPTLEQPEVEPTRVLAFIPYSFEVGGDWQGLQSTMAVMLQDGKDEEEAESFFTGDGTGNNPGGIVQTLDPSSHIFTEDINTFASEDVYALEESLPPRFQALARWVGHNAIFNKVRRFADNDGPDLWVRLQDGQPVQLLGYPHHKASAMDSTVTGGNEILLFGDFRHFLIVDRVGMSIEVVPQLFGPGGKPTGQRGIVAWWRNSSVVLADNAFRLLVVSQS